MATEEEKTEETVAAEAATENTAADGEDSGEVLSDEEREALMDGVSSGTIDSTPTVSPGEAVAYDLTNQDHIIRGRLPLLEKINRSFVRYFSGGLEQMLQKPVEISVDELNTVMISDYIHSLEIPTSLNFINVEALNGECLFAFDPEFVFSIVNIYFGGGGKHTKNPEITEFTPTELRITRLVVNRIFKDLKDAWEPVFATDFEFVKSESNPQFSCIATSREMMIVSIFHVNFGDSQGEFHIGLPFSMVEPIRGLLEGGRQKSKLETERIWLKNLKKNLGNASLELHGTVADTELSLREVFKLEAGDVIPVEMPGLVTLQVNDVPVFNGHFGVYKGSNAVRITNRFNEPDKS